MFLSFVNFYRRFIETFSRIVVELTKLLKREKKEKFADKFSLTTEAKIAFYALKEIFTKALLLKHFRLQIRTMLKIDALNFALSEIISQLNEKNKSMTLYRFLIKTYDVCRAKS